MAVGVLRRWAAMAPVPVFVARGGGAGSRPAELAADPRLRLVATPRHASVLLAAGRFPAAMGAALDRLHDQLPAPRAVVWWTPDTSAERPAALRDATVVSEADPADAVVAAHRAVLVGALASSPGVLADVPPNEFAGRGDHGQGGEGMMGGVPYGRPMAMTADDRDGLSLDRLPVTLGPFLPGFPNGLQANVTLQGSVVQELSLAVLDLGDGASLDDLDADLDDDVVTTPRLRLRWLADALRLGGLHALAARAARAARQGSSPATLSSAVRRSGLPQAWAGIGVIDGVDARARLLRTLEPDESGAERPSVGLDRLSSALVGSDWADAVAAIASFDLATDGADRQGARR
ncbi:MAG: hypothetical protein ABIV94_05815 [Acidimicrobiales bacterium]